MIFTDVKKVIGDFVFVQNEANSASRILHDVLQHKHAFCIWHSISLLTAGQFYTSTFNLQVRVCSSPVHVPVHPQKLSKIVSSHADIVNFDDEKYCLTITSRHDFRIVPVLWATCSRPGVFGGYSLERLG